MYLCKVNLEPKKWLTQKNVPEKVKPADIMILALQSLNQLGILALICYDSLGMLLFLKQRRSGADEELLTLSVSKNYPLQTRTYIHNHMLQSCPCLACLKLSYPVETVSPVGGDMGMGRGKAKDRVKEKLMTQLILRGLREVDYSLGCIL